LESVGKLLTNTNEGGTNEKKSAQTVFLVIFAIFTLIGMAFAGWPIPDSGQTKCYNDTAEIPCPAPGEDFYGQDAQYTTNLRSYTKLDAGGNDLSDSAASWTMVRDNDAVKQGVKIWPR